MKKQVFLVLGLLVFAFPLTGESYRNTTSDMYVESCTAGMMRQTGANAAEIRAEQYRSMYETCDEHHNCRSEASSVVPRPIETGRSQEQTETVKPFTFVPAWM